MKKILLLIFIIVTVNICLFADKPEITIGAGYFGETFTNPGIRIFCQISLLNYKKYSLNAKVELGFNNIRNTSNSLWFSTGLVNRFEWNSGIFLDLDFSIGYMHKWQDGKVYKYSETDGFSETKTGHPKLLLSFMPLAGIKLPDNFLPIAIFGGIGLYGELPYNSGILLHPAGILGVSYTFKFLG